MRQSRRSCNFDGQTKSGTTILLPAEAYRQNAAECERLAERATDVFAKMTFRDAAKQAEHPGCSRGPREKRVVQGEHDQRTSKGPLINGSGAGCSAPAIIINSSGDSGDDDDANSGDEGNIRRRGNHRNSSVATNTGRSSYRPNVLAQCSQCYLLGLVRSVLQTLLSLLGRNIVQPPHQVV